MSFTGISHNLMGSGILPILQATTRRRRVLIIGDDLLTDQVSNSYSASWYRRSNPLGGFTGFFASGALDTAATPFSRVSTTPANLTKGILMDPWRYPQPANPAVEYAAFFNPDASGDGTPGIYSQWPVGTQEHIWGGVAVADNSKFMECSLQAGFPQVRSPNWYKDQLLITSIGRRPAPAAGSVPILGGPSLRLGVRRAGDADSLGTASGTSITDNTLALTGLLAANSALPISTLNSGPGASNLSTRYVHTGWMFSSNSAPTGLDLVCIGNPELECATWSGQFQPGDTFPLPSSVFQPGSFSSISNALGGFDACIIQLGYNIAGCPGTALAFAGNNHWDSLLLGHSTPTPNNADYCENTVDLTNFLRTELGEIPILLISPWYANLGTTPAEKHQAYSTLVDNLKLCIDANPLGLSSIFHSDRTALINVYDPSHSSSDSKDGVIDAIWSIIHRASSSPTSTLSALSRLRSRARATHRDLPNP